MNKPAALKVSEFSSTLPATAQRDNELERTSISFPWVDDLTRALRENFPILFLVVVYMAAGFLTESLLGLPGMMQIRLHYTLFDVCAVFFTASYLGTRLIVRIPYLVDGKAGLFRMAREMLDHYLTMERVVGLLLIYLSIGPFLSTFQSFKEAIPWIQPFAWDERFMKADYYLHFGNHPWALLQPLLGRPVITRVLDLFYMAWFPLLFGFVFWMALTGRRRLRLQFFVSWVLTRIVVGTVMAIVLSSAGPCYYSYVTNSADPYLPLMKYLHSVHQGGFLWAVNNQEGLWTAKLHSIHLPLGGISAMPSMHVALAVLLALAGYQVNPWLGRVLAVFAVITHLGSVHLGWHYAIDGYIAAASTWIIWKVTLVFSSSPKFDYVGEPIKLDGL